MPPHHPGRRRALEHFGNCPRICFFACGIIPLKTWKRTKKCQRSSKNQNHAIVQKVKGQSIPLKSADALGQSPLQRKCYIAATNRAIFLNASVAASSSATKFPMAPVAIFGKLSIPKFCTVGQVAKEIDFNQIDFPKACSIHLRGWTVHAASKLLYSISVEGLVGPPWENYRI